MKGVLDVKQISLVVGVLLLMLGLLGHIGLAQESGLIRGWQQTVAAQVMVVLADGSVVTANAGRDGRVPLFVLALWNAEGARVWERSIPVGDEGTTASPLVRDIVQLLDGSFLIVGSVPFRFNNNSSTSQRAAAVHVDPQGNLLREIPLGGDIAEVLVRDTHTWIYNRSELRAAHVLTDGSIAVAGMGEYRRMDGARNPSVAKALVGLFSTSGELIWQEYYHAAPNPFELDQHLEAEAIAQWPNGQMLILGRLTDDNGSQVQLLTLAGSGAVTKVENRRLGPDAIGTAQRILVLSDGSLAVASYREHRAALVTRISPQGEELWTVEIGVPALGSLVEGRGQKLLLANHHGIHAMDFSANFLWRLTGSYRGMGFTPAGGIAALSTTNNRLSYYEPAAPEYALWPLHVRAVSAEPTECPDCALVSDDMMQLENAFRSFYLELQALVEKADQSRAASPDFLEDLNILLRDYFYQIGEH